MSQAQTGEEKGNPVAGSLLLNPSAITLTGRFEAPTTPTTFDLAVRFIGKQIEEKRRGDAGEAAIDRLWKASIFRFIPIPPGGHPGALQSPVVRDDDPFFTPEWIKVSSRQLDHQVAESDKRAKLLFGH